MALCRRSPAVAAEDAMDQRRISSAYSSLKLSQQHLGELLATGLDEPAKSKMSRVLADMLQAQDDLIVLRETLQALEFDNAALRQKLRDGGSAARQRAALLRPNPRG